MKRLAPIALVLIMAFGPASVLATGGANPLSGSAAAISAEQTHSTAASGNSNFGITVCNGTTQTLHNGTLSISGNITICAHSTLNIVDTNVTFLSFTSSSNHLLSSDLSTRYHVIVSNGGQLHLINSEITTDAPYLDGYPKLNVTIETSSVLSLVDSSFKFAGWVYVNSSSSLFLNSSEFAANPLLPIGPGNYTTDSSFGPALTVTGSSNLVTVNSSITNYYSDPGAPGPALTTNLASREGNVSVAAKTKVDWFAPPSFAQVVYDTYDSWASGRIQVTVVPATSITGTANFTLNNVTTSNVAIPALATGTPGLINITLNQSFLNQAANSVGLVGLLSSTELNTTYLSMAVTGGTGTVTGVQVDLMPQFNFNITISNKSAYYGVNSRFDLNWISSSCGSPSTSNKMQFSDHSVGYLVNTTTFSSYANTSACALQDAFRVDNTSDYWAYDWVVLNAMSSTGTPVPNATISENSLISSSKVLAGLATNASNPAKFPSLLLAAVTSATVSPGSVYHYGTTDAGGSATFALATDYLNYTSLEDGYQTSYYNLSFRESVEYINGTKTTVNTGVVVNTPKICPWPYNSTSCATTKLKAVVLPLLTADLEIEGTPTVETGGVSCIASCNVYEGDRVLVNATIMDANPQYAISGGASIPVYLFDNYSTTSDIIGPQYLSNVNFSKSASDDITFSFVEPYQSFGVHTFWVAIDPYHVAPSSGSAQKNILETVTVLPSPRVTNSNVVLTLTDMCTGAVITLPDANTCNMVDLTGSVTNTGDSKVNASIKFVWDSTRTLYSTHMILPVGVAVPVSAGLLVEYNTSMGSISLTVTSPPLAQPTYPAINALAEVNATFEDYTTLVFPAYNGTNDNATENFELMAGSSSSFHKVPAGVYNSSSYSPYGIGTNLGFVANLTNIGGEGANASASLNLETNASGSAAAWSRVMNWTIGTISSGPSNLTLPPLMWWTINSTTIGAFTGLRAFNFTVRWTNTIEGATEQYSFSHYFNVTIRPPQVTINGLGFGSSSIAIGSTQVFTIAGSLSYAGTSPASVSIFTNGTGNNLGTNCAVVSSASVASSGTLPRFSIPWNGGCSYAAGVWKLTIQVTYLGNNTWFVVPGSLTITSTTPQSQTFLQQYLWWIIIAAVVVVAVVAVLLVFRRMGKGNLVECGECGELIPESAVACPKCGAEFERDLIRCSRCGASIPAASKVCPECSILLVGDTADPLSADYSAFTQKFRKQAQKELGDNYNEGAFWDWWKRQPTYVPFSTWKQQMHVSGEGGSYSPAMAAESSASQQPLPQGQMRGPQDMGPQGGYGGGYGQQPPTGGMGGGMGMPQQGQQDLHGVSAQAEAPMKVCPSCGRNINDSFLVCPFCGAVTR